MQPPPRLFHYSLDWRFLLPSADVQNVFLLMEKNEELTEALGQVGIQPAQCLSFPELRQAKSENVPMLVLPFGLATGWVSPRDKDQLELYASLRGFLAPEGYILVGFNNLWNVPASTRTSYYASTPRRVTAQLTQAGFHSIVLFGAMRNLAIPEYIFQLEARTIQFALQNRFRRKPAALRAMGALAGTIGLARISNFLPCYYAVARA